MIRKLICFLLFLPLLNAFSQGEKKETNEVIYHVFLRSFYDSDGNHHGDFKGLQSKLDYLQDLGVTSVMLLPINASDCYHNYFATDFENLDQTLGTFPQFVSLVQDLHRRKMKVYMDMETQYVTSRHPWYKHALHNLSSPYSNYLLFDDAAHTTPATMVFGLREFKSYDGKTITATTVNLKSPEVLNYNVNLFKFFMDPNEDGKFDDGVDGFRLDHTMDNLDLKPALTNLFAEFWNPLIQKLKQFNPAVHIVAEQADWSDYGYSYFEKAGVDWMFGFGLQRAIASFDKTQLIHKADSVLVKTPQGKNQVIFLENHDLNRFASTETNFQKQKLAASLQLLIGGIPSIYYGQEIGMKGVGGNFGPNDGNDIPKREAFEWYTTTTGPGMATWYQNTGPWWTQTNLKSNDGISLEEQQSSPQSLFNYYKSLLHLRKSHESLYAGAYENLENENASVYTFTRGKGAGEVLVAANLSDQPQTFQLKNGHKYKVIFGTPAVVHNEIVELKPYEVSVWNVK